MATLKYLVLKRYTCGSSSMDHIKTLVIQMQDQEAACSNDTELNKQPAANNEVVSNSSQVPRGTTETRNPDQPSWCICGNCQGMPREIENKCCRRRDCVILLRRFQKFCLDPENLEMCIKNTTDI